MESKINTIEKEKIKLKKPKQFKVIMHNDDFTTMEFVIYILTAIFKKEILEAEKIMLDVHNKGIGIVGIYSYDIAKTKVQKSQLLAKEEGFPFKITIEVE